MRLSLILIPALLGALALGALTGCTNSDSANSTPASPPPPEVQVTTVTQRDVPIIKEWVGTLDGGVNVSIQSRVTGYLISQDYQEGSLVRKGGLLFQIDAKPFEVALAQAKANLAKSAANQLKAEQDEKRFTKLYAQAAVSEQERDNAVQANAAAKADVLAQKAAVADAQLNVGYTRITAPVDGIVGLANSNLGDLISAGSTNLTMISSVNPIKVYFSMSEQEYMATAPWLGPIEALPEARRPAQIEMRLANGDLYPDKGTFDFTDRQVDTRTGTIRVAGTFPNPRLLLRPGQFARVRIAIQTLKGALLVPQRAVNELQGSYQVVVVDPDNKGRIRPVQVGAQVGTMWVITKGLASGERVVAEGLQKVQDGMTVAPRPWAPPKE